MTTTASIKLWIVHCFLFLSVVPHLTARGDPTRIPTPEELSGLSPLVPPPSEHLHFVRNTLRIVTNELLTGCANNCTDVVAALNSSTEIWYTSTLFGGCVTTAPYVRTAKLCVGLESAQCSLDVCVFEPESLLSWVYLNCNSSTLTLDARSRWNASTSEREASLVPGETILDRPSCSTDCANYSELGDSASLASLCASDPDCADKYTYFPPMNGTILCQDLVDPNNCPNSCIFGQEPRTLLAWVNSTCPHFPFPMDQLENVTMAKEKIWVSEWIPALLPWRWGVQAYPKEAGFNAFGVNSQISPHIPLCSSQ
jgi:hypothetical protein